ncbi:RidA family protein [Acidaminobacter sp. JC074]|uniref:RidA family protein n=1 Tax=Acidaminobacter sp. JC074 TaxID=2530199 RepID=UPI001F0EDF06|nr:RidA family protein [Acidaminobacter sp. JC074]MCH4888904.1 RidA family protein [Acidaminobacter sp. JC074]
MNVESKLEKLKLELPEAPKAAAVYVPALVANSFVFISGQTPKNGSELLYKGKLGVDLGIEEGKKAAEVAILRALSLLKEEVGSLDKIKRIVKITGYVNSAPDFYNQSQVIDGASELLESVFGEIGKHTRVAIGSVALPGNAAVEVDLIAEI